MCYTMEGYTIEGLIYVCYTMHMYGVTVNIASLAMRVVDMCAMNCIIAIYYNIYILLPQGTSQDDIEQAGEEEGGQEGGQAGEEEGG